MKKKRAPKVRADNRLVVEMLRLKEGESHIVRSITGQIYGLVTHYLGSRSVICPGDGTCTGVAHRFPNWRGYSPVYRWLEDVRKWLPATIELSSSAELDIRGLWKAGQEWAVSRRERNEEDSSPTRLRLISEPVEVSVLPLFDFMAPIHAVYNAVAFPASVRNPLPARVLAAQVEAPPPATAQPQTAVPLPATTQDYDKLREVMQGFGRMPVDKNGHR